MVKPWKIIKNVKTMQNLIHVANLTLRKKTVFAIVHCIKYSMICTSGYFTAVVRNLGVITPKGII